MPRADLTQQARREMDARAGFARQDMAFGLATFVRPVVRGKRMYIEGVRQEWMGGTLILSGPEIDAGDLGVLLALLRLALQSFPECDIKPGADVPGLLPDSQHQHREGANRAVMHQAVCVKTTMAAICRELGRSADDGRAHASVRASLRRLSAIVVDGRSGVDPDWAQTHLIHGSAGRGRGAVEVTLSYRLTWAVLGNGPYTRVSMYTWRRLSPVAQVLYHWLCSWRPGAGTCPVIGIDTLTRHVWREVARGAKQRERRQQVRAALREIATAAPDEWQVEDGSGAASIRRLPLE